MEKALNSAMSYRHLVAPRNNGCQGTNKFHPLYKRNSYITSIEINMKGPNSYFRHSRISLTFGSVWAGCNCIYHSKRIELFCANFNDRCLLLFTESLWISGEGRRRRRRRRRKKRRNKTKVVSAAIMADKKRLSLQIVCHLTGVNFSRHVSAHES